MAQIKEFRAKVHFLTPEEGGRSKAVLSGYHPAFDFGLKGEAGEKMYNDGIIELEGRDRVAPGEESYARIKPLCPELLQEVLKPNTRFDVTEGGLRIVGKGIIVEVYPEG